MNVRDCEYSIMKEDKSISFKCENTHKHPHKRVNYPFAFF